MISDVLSDALIEIKRYREEMPQCYDSLKSVLDPLVEHMTSVRILLDTPPTTTKEGT